MTETEQVTQEQETAAQAVSELVLHSEPVKPPSLNTLMVERMDRIDIDIAALTGRVDEIAERLVAVETQGSDTTFWLKVMVVALLILTLVFGVFDGLLLAVLLH